MFYSIVAWITISTIKPMRNFDYLREIEPLQDLRIYCEAAEAECRSKYVRRVGSQLPAGVGVAGENALSAQEHRAAGESQPV